MATLVATQGSTQQELAGAAGQWQSATSGATFAFGDALRTGKKSTAHVELFDGSSLKLGASTQIRFRAKASGASKRPEAGLDIQTGEATVEAGKKALRSRLQGGVAVLEAGSLVRLVPMGDNRTRLQVSVGETIFESTNGAYRAGVGQTFEVDIGGVILEEPPKAAAKPAEAAPPKTPVDEAVIATIVGSKVQVRPNDDSRWVQQKPGTAELIAGTQLRVPAGNSVLLKRGSQSATVKGSGLYVVEPSSIGLIRSLSGQIEVASQGEDTVVVVPGGLIIARGLADSASKGNLTIKPNQETLVQTESGQIDLRHKDGSGTESLRAGESATLSPDTDIAVAGRGPAKVYFYAPVGESFAVRDPKPPSLVGLRFGDKCKSGGIIEVSRSKQGKPIVSASGGHHAHLKIPSGSYHYKLRCETPDGVAAEAVATGTLRVLRDSGKAQLPVSAPSTFVDTDGRRYTVLYQNLLPAIITDWPAAPANAGGYRLQVESAGNRIQNFNTAQPHFEMSPGSLSDGSYRLTFSTADGSRKSRVSELLIRFDNAAPSASLKTPDDGSFAPGAVVEIAGVALEGWAVSALDVPIPLDSQARFSTSATVPAEQVGIAIRLANPKRGIHYYVRRASGQ